MQLDLAPTVRHTVEISAAAIGHLHRVRRQRLLDERRHLRTQGTARRLLRSRKPMQRRQTHHCRCEKYSPLPHAVTVPKPPHTEEGAAASEMLRGILVPQPFLEVNPFREKFFDFLRGDVDDEMVTTTENTTKSAQNCTPREEFDLPKYCTCVITFF